jgi:hypothetical protein
MGKGSSLQSIVWNDTGQGFLGLCVALVPYIESILFYVSD